MSEIHKSGGVDERALQRAKWLKGEDTPEQVKRREEKMAEWGSKRQAQDEKRKLEREKIRAQAEIEVRKEQAENEWIEAKRGSYICRVLIWLGVMDELPPKRPKGPEAEGRTGLSA